MIFTAEEKQYELPRTDYSTQRTAILHGARVNFFTDQWSIKYLGMGLPMW